MNEKPETNYRAWLAKAESDLLNIENNVQADRVPWDTVCFHAVRTRYPGEGASEDEGRAVTEAAHRVRNRVVDLLRELRETEEAENEA